VGQEAPGQAVTHYAPDVPCFIVSASSTSTNTTTTTTSSNDGSSSGADPGRPLTLSPSTLRNSAVVIDFGQRLVHLAPRCLAYRDLSASGDSAEAARNLFKFLRWAELVAGAERVFIAEVSAAPQMPSAGGVHIDGSLSVGTGDKNGDGDVDMTLGVADRIFRAASGVRVALIVMDRDGDEEIVK
jgi:hypothetical protein